jgi:hypothetical protein
LSDAAIALEPELQLASDVGGFALDPAGFIWYAFPWGVKNTPLANRAPRQWTLDVCESIRAKLTANHLISGDRWQVVQEACASGHGIGKSAFMAQLVLWAMSTCRECKGVVTANTDTQLRTKTWPELVKWHGMSITRHWFTVTATSLYHVEYPKTWRIDAIPWSEHNTEAFAGLHNEGKRIFLGMDEASGIARPVWDTSEGALTDTDTEIIWIAWGNPTRASGRFRECWTRQREFWSVRNVDSRTVEGTNKDRIERWRRLWGENSQFFKVRVRGEFAEADENQLLSLAWIAEARIRGGQWQPDGSLPRTRISVDVSDGGEDDTIITVASHYASMVLVHKQIFVSFDPSVAVIQTAQRVHEIWKGWDCRRERGDDIVVDSLGVGAGTAGYLMLEQLPVIAYKGGESSANPLQFRNRRVQSYIGLRNGLRDGRIAFAEDMLPDAEAWELFEEQAASIRSKPGTERLEDLITKEEMRRDGIDSPDHIDSLAMQYATQTPTLQLVTAGQSQKIAAHVVQSRAREGFIGG